MRLAVFAITRAGARLAGALVPTLPGASLYVSPRWQAAAEPAASEPLTSLAEAVRRHFAAGDSLVVFAAVGVVVRLIAPILRDKWCDPAVVAVDDAGRYAVCVLSGHQGGGNALTERVASALGAAAVVTTASEAHGLPAVDLLGQRWGWRVEYPDAVKAVSAALVNGEPVGAVQEAGESGWWPAGGPPAVRLCKCCRAGCSRYAGNRGDGPCGARAVARRGALGRAAAAHAGPGGGRQHRGATGGDRSASASGGRGRGICLGQPGGRHDAGPET